eukprot:s804_g16.t1
MNRMNQLLDLVSRGAARVFRMCSKVVLQMCSKEQVDAGPMHNMNQFLDLMELKKLNLGNGDQFREAWGLAGQFLEEKPVMTETDLEKMDFKGAVLLQFDGSKIEEDKALAATPLQRNVGHGEPLNTMADYMLLAVARQLTLLKPKAVSAIHSFEELYGGRLITEPRACFRGAGCPCFGG